MEKFKFPATQLKKLPDGKIRFVEPMKSQITRELPDGKEWIYEIKFDGVRALAIKRGNQLELVSRNAKDLTQRYAPIASALRALPPKEAVLDGEIVAVDEQGRSSFQLLQCFQQPGPKPPIFYYVFDLIQLDGKEYECRLHVDLSGTERILGRDVLNQLEILFRGPAKEVVVNP